jgi:hypothetical protein
VHGFAQAAPTIFPAAAYMCLRDRPLPPNCLTLCASAGSVVAAVSWGPQHGSSVVTTLNLHRPSFPALLWHTVLWAWLAATARAAAGTSSASGTFPCRPSSSYSFNGVFVCAVYFTAGLCAPASCATVDCVGHSTPQPLSCFVTA